MKKERKGLMAAILLLVVVAVVLVLIILKSELGTKETKKIGSSEAVYVKVTEQVSIPKVDDAESSYDEEEGVVTIRSDRLKNAEDNSLNLQFIITTKDGEELYRSELLKPGEQLDVITFETDLEPGTYSVYLDTESFDASGANIGGTMEPLVITVGGNQDEN